MLANQTNQKESSILPILWLGVWGYKWKWIVYLRDISMHAITNFQRTSSIQKLVANTNIWHVSAHVHTSATEFTKCFTMYHVVVWFKSSPIWLDEGSHHYKFWMWYILAKGFLDLLQARLFYACAKVKGLPHQRQKWFTLV